MDEDNSTIEKSSSKKDRRNNPTPFPEVLGSIDEYESREYKLLREVVECSKEAVKQRQELIDRLDRLIEQQTMLVSAFIKLVK